MAFRYTMKKQIKGMQLLLAIWGEFMKKVYSFQEILLNLQNTIKKQLQENNLMLTIDMQCL